MRATMRAFLKDAVVGFSSRTGDEVMGSILNLPGNETTLAYRNKHNNNSKKGQCRASVAAAGGRRGGESSMSGAGDAEEIGTEGAGAASSSVDYAVLQDLFS